MNSRHVWDKRGFYANDGCHALCLSECLPSLGSQEDIAKLARSVANHTCDGTPCQLLPVQSQSSKWSREAPSREAREAAGVMAFLLAATSACSRGGKLLIISSSKSSSFQLPCQPACSTISAAREKNPPALCQLPSTEQGELSPPSAPTLMRNYLFIHKVTLTKPTYQSRTESHLFNKPPLPHEARTRFTHDTLTLPLTEHYQLPTLSTIEQGIFLQSGTSQQARTQHTQLSATPVPERHQRVQRAKCSDLGAVLMLVHPRPMSGSYAPR